MSLAAQAGSVGCLEELIDQAQVDPQRVDHDGMSPVHYAAQAGKTTRMVTDVSNFHK